jgi:hypothetical protein
MYCLPEAASPQMVRRLRVSVAQGDPLRRSQGKLPKGCEPGPADGWAHDGAQPPKDNKQLADSLM